MGEPLTFRAHARLLIMLGEQLIKNDRIALVELVKNAYDADATEVVVDFRNFSESLEARDDSTIAITDNGVGMSERVLRDVWMSPATPSKALAKQRNPQTPRGRVLQGEKGIGRFATFKLGSQVSVISRAKGEDSESTLIVDISELDDGLQSDASERLLEDVDAQLDNGAPVHFAASPYPHGTQLEIGSLRSPWSVRSVRAAYDDLGRLQPIMWGGPLAEKLAADFVVRFHRDGADLNLGRDRAQEFQALRESAVLRVTGGRYDDDKGEIRFQINGRETSLSLDSAEIRGLKRFREHFTAESGDHPRPTCGSFEFEFDIFDFSASAPANHYLDTEDKKVLKEHRIYLYRDGIRVYPYGDPQDDWLEVDAIRGTESARSMFSNDQLIGFVAITQAGNPQLKDKTNREGLLEAGTATRDFVVMIQTILSWLRSKPYEQYAASNRRVRERQLRGVRLDRYIEALRHRFDLSPQALEQVDALEAAIATERELSVLQLGRTEQLAGVGLSVETASHDLIAAGTEALRMAKHIVADLRLLDLSREPIFAVATSLVTRLEFVNARFKDVQGLFVSTRQKRASIDVMMLMRRVRSIYSALHADKDIKFEIDSGERLDAVTTEGAVLQCVINLVDNATYWLMSSPHEPKVIRAFVSGGRTLVVTDSGPGVNPQDEGFIFEPFYSGKGDAGKGLGLYIARQNGIRSGFTVELGARDDPRELPGATFRVEFAEIGGKG